MATTRTILCVLALAAMLGGCNGDNEGGGLGDGLDWWSGTSENDTDHGGSVASPRPRSDKPFTILLRTHTGPTTHRQEAELFQERVRQLGWENVFVEHGQESSQLYWGRYESIEDAQANLKKAKSYIAPSGAPIFKQAIVVPIPERRPAAADDKLNLVNADGAYSVLVAVFFDEPELDYVGRKSFAEQYARDLRKRGYEAYYYHGPVRSGVTIGVFDQDAIAASTDPASGQQQTKVVSRKMKSILDDPNFQYLAVNGLKEKRRVQNPATGQWESVLQKPHPVRIPSPS